MTWAYCLPLQGLKVADFGVGMAAALTAKFLAECGADVHRIEPARGDPFYDIYPAYRAWRSCLGGREPFSPDRERQLLEEADICLLGGEDFPGHQTQRDTAALAACYPRLIVLEITATLPEPPLEPLHGADILVQARAGLVFETYHDRPALMGFVPSAYGAALMGLTALAVALYQREGSGTGQVVRAGLLEGALAWLTAYWGRAENEAPNYRFNVPLGARPLTLLTRDGEYVHVVLGSAGAKYRLYKILGVDDPLIEPNDAGLPNPSLGPQLFFGDVDLLAPYAAKIDSADLLAALACEGVVAEKVVPPGAPFDDAQVKHNDIVGRSKGGVEYVGQPISWQASTADAASYRRRPAAGAPLAGVKVVDFGAFVAGPASSVALADLGADVIKVEPPGSSSLQGTYRFYSAANRGKRSIAVDMKCREGLNLAHRLARQADIVCSNFKVGVAERLGIDANTLHALQPDKIVLFNAGYGATGPKANNPAFDPSMQACCGFELRSAGRGNPPMLNRTMMVDFCGAMLGQIGVLIALYARARDGSGSAVTVPLLNAGLFLMSDIVRSANGEVLGPVTLLPDQTGYHPAEKLYRVQDGWIAISARGDNTARSLAEALNLPDVAARPREAWGDSETTALTAAVQRLTADQCLALLAARDVPAELCRESAERDFIADDRLVAAGRVYEAERPELGKTRGLGRLYSLSAGAPTPRGDLSDRHRDGLAILKEVGLSVDEIDALVAAKVVG